LYAFFYEALGQTLRVTTSDKEDRRLIDMFHSHVEPESIMRIPKVFAKSDSNLRILISSIAFGMGIQIPNVEYIIHWGPSQDVLLYWQEVGRCARDGRQGKALLYTPPYSVSVKTSTKEMIEYTRSGSQVCLRKFILRHIYLKEMSVEKLEQMCGGANCCSHCDLVHAN
jgi:superfamily II DNA helicase RecQ